MMVPMADRPAADDPNQQPAPGADEGVSSASTEPLPPARPAPAAQPERSATPPPSQGPAWSGAAPDAGSQSTPRRLWGEATATTGSRIALAVAAVLGVIVLVAGIGLVGSFVVHRLDRAGVVFGSDDDDRSRLGDDGRERSGDTPFGNNGRGRGNGNGRSDGQGRSGHDGNSGMGNHGLGNNGSNGRALGGAAGSLRGLGTILHGEFTTTLTGEPAVMLFQVGEVTETTEGESMTVRSADDFEATYTLDDTTTTSVIPAEGDRVRVVAAEDGNTAVLVQVLGADD